jgi:hypothetical protein
LRARRLEFVGGDAWAGSVAVCYADVMAIQRITISVPEAVAKRIRMAAGEKPVSTWVTDLIENYLDDAELDRQWQAFLKDVNPSPKEVRRAGALFDRLTRPSRRRGAA